MINGRYANSFCCEDISLIENYEQAVNDKTQTWDCHHRLETDLGLSKAELIERNLYYDRPASELIFMTHSEHMKLHNHGENHPMYGRRGKDNPMYGKNRPDISGKKNGMYGTQRYGEENPAYGRTWMNNGITRVFPKTQEEIEHYRELGYSFGYKLK